MKITNDILEYLAAAELTIASGAITVTQANHKLQPETGTADDLATINGTSDGEFGVLYASDFGTDTITIKHNTGNILCMGGADITLSNGCVFWYSNGTKVFISGGGGSSSGGGKYPAFVRLSVSSGVPNPTSDLLAQTAIYAMPLGGNTYPQWGGTDFAQQVFSEQTLTLNAAHTANSVYDIYLWLDGATQRIVTGPAWTSATSRGTGAGTAETEEVNGVTVNKVQMTVRNGANTYTMPARYGTVIGTFVASANGQVEWSAKYRGIYNFYNQLEAPVHICPGYNNDNTPTSYTFNSTTWVEANGGTGSRIKFVLGRPAKVDFLIKVRCAPGSGQNIIAAVGIDTVTSPKTSVTSLAGTTASDPLTTDNNSGIPLGIGSHYAAMLLVGSAGGVQTVYADAGRSGGAAADLENSFVNGSILM